MVQETSSFQGKIENSRRILFKFCLQAYLKLQHDAAHSVTGFPVFLTEAKMNFELSDTAEKRIKKVFKIRFSSIKTKRFRLY